MTILKEYTSSKHREVEALPMIQCIMKGPSVEQYVYYLYELKEIYRVLESHANQKGILNGLDGIERYQNLENAIVTGKQGLPISARSPGIGIGRGST